MLAGSPPRAMTTGIFSPRSAIVRQCAAPTLWRCQCIANVFLLNTCTRYIPTFLTPDSGLLVMTPPSVMYGPPSSGQQIGTGNWARSTSDSSITVLWQAGRPTVLGGNFAISASRGSIASLANKPSGTLRASSSAMRAPTWSRHSTPSASDMRRSEPKRLTATGYSDFPPPRSIGCANSSAGPPPGDFMQRSATSVISLSTDTGRATRVRSPVFSIAATNSRRLSSAIMNGADAAGQAFETDARESRGHEPQRQRVGGNRSGAGRFVLAQSQHRDHEVGTDHAAAKTGLPGELGGKVQCAGADIEIGAVGFSFPAEARHGGAPPGPIHVEAEQVVQEVVARRDRREHATDVGWRTTHRRER